MFFIQNFAWTPKILQHQFPFILKYQSGKSRIVAPNLFKYEAPFYLQMLWSPTCSPSRKKISFPLHFKPRLTWMLDVLLDATFLAWMAYFIIPHMGGYRFGASTHQKWKCHHDTRKDNPEKYIMRERDSGAGLCHQVPGPIYLKGQKKKLGGGMQREGWDLASLSLSLTGLAEGDSVSTWTLPPTDSTGPPFAKRVLTGLYYSSPRGFCICNGFMDPLQ